MVGVCDRLWAGWCCHLASLVHVEMFFITLVTTIWIWGYLTGHYDGRKSAHQVEAEETAERVDQELRSRKYA